MPLTIGKTVNCISFEDDSPKPKVYDGEIVAIEGTQVSVRVALGVDFLGEGEFAILVFPDWNVFPTPEQDDVLYARLSGIALNIACGNGLFRGSAGEAHEAAKEQA